MSDTRSRIEKLRAMASQTVSPHEAAIARRILSEIQHAPGREEEVWRSHDADLSRMGISVDPDGFTVRWSGDLRKEDAPIGAMIAALRRRREGGRIEG